MTRTLRRILAAMILVSSGCGRGTNRSATSTTMPGRSSVPGATGAATTSSATPSAENGWWTYSHDGARSGATADGPASPASIQRRWVSPALDGDLYAQPLVVGDRVVAATENDTVYVLNAATGAITWSTHLGEPVAGASLPCGNVNPVGITSTPVIDVTAGRLYAASMVQPGEHMLFVLDLSTGRVIDSKVIDAPHADPTTHNQRGALALSGGKVLVPFGGRFGDCGTYHGQLVAVPITATGLGAPAAFTLPTVREGGFWNPAGAVTDAEGNIYLASGNSAGGAAYDYGNSVIRLGADLKLGDSFAPTNWAELNAGDTDLGSTGPVLLAGHQLFQIGKAGVGYLLDTGHLGGVGRALFQDKVCGSAFGAAAQLDSTVFVPCSSGVAAVTVRGGRFSTRWTADLATPGPTIVTPGAVWCIATDTGDLVALNIDTGKQLFRTHIGSIPSRFVTPAAGNRQIVVAADRTVMAFGNSL